MSISVTDFLNKNKITFKNISLYEQAFVHRSYINENPKFALGHNERLEFLGDSVLELVVTDYLFRKFPDHAEGDLTSYRAALVNTNSLGQVAQKLGANDFLKLSKGESKDKESRARFSILADTYEALLGAMYLDSDYKSCVRFVESTLLVNIDDIIAGKLFKDPKSKIQELAQEKLQITPVYKVITETGPDHNKVFTVGVYFQTEIDNKPNSKLICEGVGNSKQLAEIDAAKNAIEKLKWI
jgi:ribonuclease III